MSDPKGFDALTDYCFARLNAQSLRSPGEWLDEDFSDVLTSMRSDLVKELSEEVVKAYVEIELTNIALTLVQMVSMATGRTDADVIQALKTQMEERRK
jgi:hypothetical protein